MMPTPTPTPLSSREVSQLLRDIALGVRTVRRLGDASWAEIGCGPMSLECDGWQITLFNDNNALAYCVSCLSPCGRAYVFEAAQGFGSNPVEWLSTWEHRQFGMLLGNL
ncbi:MULTISPECIES: hypothetical protein [unclassified Pseudomonas]|uniref:DUF7693 family protein n=1 Tax=unclassified Pseudomonas TaxID=196821 RepID=UPI002113BB6B|nr:MULTISPECIES: hypothetical protein [unclassified Pseudomonas]